MASTGIDPDGQLLGLLGREIADAALDREVHLDLGAGLERQEVQLGVDDLDVSGLADVGRGDGTGARLVELQLRRVRRRSS